MVRLWSPKRANGNDLARVGIPVLTDNQGNGYILRKHYTTSRPTSRILQEMEVRNLANDIAAIPTRRRGDSGKRSLMSGKTSRGAPTELGDAISETPIWQRGSSGIRTFKKGRRWRAIRLHLCKKETSFKETPG